MRLKELPLGHAADQPLGQLVGGQGLEGGPEVVRGQHSVLLLVEDPVQDEPPGGRDVQGLGEQVAEEVHRHPAVAEHVGEPVMLGARPAHPQHVVEEKGVLVTGGEPFELEIRPVQDDAGEPPGFGVDLESHASILTTRAPVHPRFRGPVPSGPYAPEGTRPSGAAGPAARAPVPPDEDGRPACFP
ncbi:hypothetical protein RKD37_002484 [Streptomyces ambofaciens]